MRPLTDHTPKPLLQINGKALIEYHIESLRQAGITDIIINTAWLGEKISDYLGNGDRYGLNLTYSREQTALETAGGISKALPLLGDNAFIVVNADIWTNFDFSMLLTLDLGADLAQLVLVQTPDYLPGDFCLEGTRIRQKSDNSSMTNTRSQLKMSGPLTYSGIACYSPRMFNDIEGGQHLALRPLLDNAIAESQLAGVKTDASWLDVGTPERLETLRQAVD